MLVPVFLKKTHYLFAAAPNGRLLAIDAGWPGLLREYQRTMKGAGLRFQDLAWAVVTHFHIDHAGLISEFLELGIECLVFEHQLKAIDAMELTLARHAGEYSGYRKIDRSRLTVLPIERSREALAQRGIDGECFATPGHSVDSVSFQSGDEVAIGDLSLPNQTAEDDLITKASWDEIRGRDARVIHPSHAPMFRLL